MIYKAVRQVLTQSDRRQFYRSYPFAVTPVTDDHPFFFHFFKWQQAPELLSALGRTWQQPFGGSGYFLLLALLALVLLLSILLIVSSLLLPKRTELFRAGSRLSLARALGCFGNLGRVFTFCRDPALDERDLVGGPSKLCVCHPGAVGAAVIRSGQFRGACILAAGERGIWHSGALSRCVALHHGLVNPDHAGLGSAASHGRCHAESGATGSSNGESIPCVRQILKA